MHLVCTCTQYSLWPVHHNVIQKFDLDLVVTFPKVRLGISFWITLWLLLEVPVQEIIYVCSLLRFMVILIFLNKILCHLVVSSFPTTSVLYLHISTFPDRWNDNRYANKFLNHMLKKKDFQWFAVFCAFYFYNNQKMLGWKFQASYGIGLEL